MLACGTFNPVPKAAIVSPHASESAPQSADMQAFDDILARVRDGQFDDGEIFALAAQQEAQDQFDRAIMLYRGWLSHTDSPLAFNGWFNLGILLLRTHEFFLSEQAFLNAQAVNPSFDGAAAARESFDFRAANKSQELLYSLFMQVRFGQLDFKIFLMAGEQLGAAGPSQALFELYWLAVRYLKLPRPASYWFEMGLIAKRLGYTLAARKAFLTAQQLDAEFSLPGIALAVMAGRDNLPGNLLDHFSLLYSDKTLPMFDELKEKVDYATWATCCQGWLANMLGSVAYDASYRLGLDCQRLGKLVEAKMAFTRSLELNPQFHRARFGLGSGSNPADYIDEMTRYDAQQILTGRMAGPQLPSNSGSELDALIHQAPHLYKNMVRSHVRLITAQQSLRQHSGPVTYGYEETKEHQRLALEELQCLRRKYQIYANGGVIPEHLKTGRSAFVFSWSGVGDHIYVNGAARYLATRYDQVYVATTHTDPEGIMHMYRDDPNIIWQYYKQEFYGNDVLTQAVSIRCITDNIFGKDGFYSFQYNNNKDWYKFPDGYYNDYGIEPVYSTDYFHVQQFPEGEELLRLAQNAAPKFIFTHTKGSNRFVNHVPLELIAREPDTLVINPDFNPYPEGHKYHAVAQKFLWPPVTDTVCYPIFWYIQTMMHAAEIHVIDSSFWALTHYIPKVRQDQKITCYTVFDPFLVNGIGVNFPVTFVRISHSGEIL